MLEKRFVVFAVLLAMVIISVACGPREVPAGATPLGLPADVSEAAKQAVSESTGVPAEEIEIVRADQIEWTDTCLELEEEDEFCGQVLTPGWRVILRAEGREYEIHTDLSADTVRVKE